MQLYKDFDPIVLEQLIPTFIQMSEPVTAHFNSIFHFVYNIDGRKLHWTVNYI